MKKVKIKAGFISRELAEAEEKGCVGGEQVEREILESDLKKYHGQFSFAASFHASHLYFTE